jgi:GNAT superfamily N-acetyltransferase
MCFSVAPGHRGKGVARGLLQAAIGFTRERGAAAYEGYPVRTDRRLSNDAAYPGTDRLFASEGFREVPSASPGRSSQIIMRKLL